LGAGLGRGRTRRLPPEPGALERQVDPSGGQLLVAPVNRDLLAHRRDLVSGDIFGVALHLVGVAELVIRSLPAFWAAILAGQGAGTHRAELGQLGLDRLDLTIEDF